MFNKEELSFEQKIDYIYNDLKKKRAAWFLKWIIRLFILGLIVHFYFFILPTINKEKVANKIWDRIINIVAPLIEKTVNKIDVSKLQEQKNISNNKW